MPSEIITTELGNKRYYPQVITDLEDDKRQSLPSNNQNNESSATPTGSNNYIPIVEQKTIIKLLYLNSGLPPWIPQALRTLLLVKKQYNHQAWSTSNKSNTDEQ